MGMCIQPLGLGDRRCNRTDRLRGAFIQCDQAHLDRLVPPLHPVTEPAGTAEGPGSANAQLTRVSGRRTRKTCATAWVSSST